MDSHAAVAVITARQPSRLAKGYSLERDGTLIKSGAGSLVRGHAEVVHVQCLDQFAGLLETLIMNQALTYGVPAQAPVEIVPREEWAREFRPAGKLPRTNETFGWPSGPGIMMLDHDPLPDGPSLSRDALVGALRDVAPGLANAAMLWWCSASSYIVNTFTDEELSGLRGQRLYLLVADARDIPRAGAALVDRLWAAGYGCIQVSKSGALLERTIIDATVWQPSRLDFAAGAVCTHPLIQQRGDTVLIPGTGEIVDTREAIPDPDPSTCRAAERARLEAKRAAEPDAGAARGRWIDERVGEMVNPATATKQDVDRARRVAVGAVLLRRLAGDFPIIVVQDGREETITVGAAMDNPDRWHGVRTLDPVEPEYDGRRVVGRLYLMGSRPNLFSFAHGGVTYRLVRQPERVEIVRGHDRETAEAALKVMREAPDLFDFGGALAHVEAGRVRPLDEYSTAFHLGGVTQFWRWKDMPNGDPIEVDENPPPRVVRMILSLGEARRLKRLEAIITAPTLRPDGSVLDRPGYDPATGLLYEPDEDPIAVPAEPSRQAVRDALNHLLIPFELFPLEGPTDWGVLLAALLTAVVRPVLPTSPAFAFDAPTKGSGKTLLAQSVGALASGVVPTIWPHTAGRDDEETRKRLATMLRTGERALLWDNIVGNFDSAALASALTARTFADRILGRTETLTLPNRSLFLLTGNNLSMAGDMPRRVLSCRINPHTDRPWARQFDLEPRAWTLAHRQSMAAAALTLLRAWLTSGAARAQGRTASFEDWDDWVRQCVAWIGRDIAPGQFADPMIAIEASTTADPETDTLRSLLVALRSTYGDTPFTARQLADIARDYADRSTNYSVQGAQRDVAEALRDLAPTAVTVKSIGRLLMYRRDRMIDGLVLQGDPDRKGVMTWQVACLEVHREAAE